jgi:cell division protein FtsB
MRKIVLIILLSVELLLIYSFSSRAISVFRSLERISILRSTKEKVQSEYYRLVSELSYAQSDSYVEEIARTKLSFGRPDDYVYIVPEDKRQPVPLPSVKWPGEEKSYDSLDNMKKWIEVFYK